MKKTFLVFVLLLAFITPARAANLKTLRVGLPNDAKSLDPLRAVDTMSFTVIKHINEPLVTVDGRTKKLVPVLAERWEILDPCTYKFYLKKGVRFHNGEELTADDVVYSLKRTLSPESLYAKSKAKAIDPNGFEIIDKYTVIVRTLGPAGGWLESMKHPYACIFNRKAMEEAGKDYYRHPIGTGPYKFKKWVKGERIELTAFDDYHGGKPKSKNLDFYVIADDSSRVIALETGKLDMIYEVPSNEYERINSDGRAKVVMAPGHNLYYLGMNTQKGALKDRRVRMAIEYAINKEAYIHVVYQDKAVQPSGPVVPSSTYTPGQPKVYPCDPARAKALLKEAGYPDGLTLNLWVSSSQHEINGATVIQSMLANVGIKINISVMESSVFDDKVRSNDQDLIISTWGMQTNRDAGQFWLSLFHSSSIGTTNWTALNDKIVDEGIDLANSSVDPAVRKAAFDKVWERLDEVHPFVCLAVPNELYGGRRDLQGMEDFCDGRLNYLGNLTVEK